MIRKTKLTQYPQRTWTASLDLAYINNFSIQRFKKKMWEKYKTPVSVAYRYTYGSYHNSWTVRTSHSIYASNDDKILFKVTNKDGAQAMLGAGFDFFEIGREDEIYMTFEYQFATYLSFYEWLEQI